MAPPIPFITNGPRWFLDRRKRLKEALERGVGPVGKRIVSRGCGTFLQNLPGGRIGTGVGDGYLLTKGDRGHGLGMRNG